MSVNFRICTESDLTIVGKYVVSLYQEDPPGMEMNSEKFNHTFWEFINKPEKGRIIVFSQDNIVVGYAIVVFFWSNEYGGDVIEVDELFVHEDYRGHGIGTTFFEWLEKTSGKKAVALSLQTTPKNEYAVHFYKHLGFEASLNRYFMKLLPQNVN